jgi:hypothetical protein
MQSCWPAQQHYPIPQPELLDICYSNIALQVILLFSPQGNFEPLLHKWQKNIPARTKWHQATIHAVVNASLRDLQVISQPFPLPILPFTPKHFRATNECTLGAKDCVFFQIVINPRKAF